MITINTQRLILRTPDLEDALNWKAFEERNRLYLNRWESTTGEQLTSLEQYRQKLHGWLREIEEEKALRFLIFSKNGSSDQLIGICNFTEIVRGAFQACYLGYKIDQAYEGRGMMYEALTASIPYVFQKLNLHRIMANYMPENMRSAKLLQRLGFQIEGRAKDYLRINGQWQEHVLTSLTNTHWRDFSKEIY